MAATRSDRFNAGPVRGDRTPVAAAAAPVYLHIQTDVEAPTRVLEMGTGPIRVGRGIQCEVRLNQVGLGEVQAILRYRNNEWQVQPVGPPGRIWVDGRPTEQQRYLAVGMPLRVGQATLTIHQANTAGGGRGSFDAPISVDVEPIETAPAPVPPPAPAPIMTPASPPLPEPVVEATPADPIAEPTLAGGDERVQRWQSRLDQRDQWLKDRQSEKRWEARWKAAGETIRARSGRPTPPPTSPSTSTPPPAPPPPPTHPEALTTRSPLVGRVAPVRSVEPRPVFSPTRRLSEPGPAPRPEPARPEVEPAPVVIPHKVKAVVPATLPVVEWSSAPTLAPVEPGAALADHPASPPAREVVDPPPAIEEARVEPVAEPLVALDDLVVVEIESELVVDLAVETESERAVDSGRTELVVELATPEALSEPSILADWEETPPTRPDPAEPGTSPSEPALAPAPMARRVAVEEEVRPPSPEPRVASAARQPTAVPPTSAGHEFPSARTIFDAQGTRASGPLPGPARPSRVIEPTEALPPGGWTIPLPLGWLPALALVLTLGTGTVGLAVVWSLESLGANLGLRLATRAEGRSLTVDPELLPKATWWRTSAGHLAAWGIALERSGKSAEARELEADARTVSPLGARARFLQEPGVGAEADEMASIRLGPTRDVVTLTAMGHRLRREGKKADAIRAYHAALAIAASTARSTLGRPVFRVDSPSNRYQLPHSTLLDAVARDMEDAGEWTAEEWTEATPEFGPALLAVARALRGKHPEEADSRLEAICQTADRALDPQFDAAEDRAATAEAMAERGRWTDAVAQYHLAIDGETRDLDRRVWWFNLAELAGKTGDLDARNQAIENAKGADLSDEVTQRAANAHRLNPESTKLSAQNR